MDCLSKSCVLAKNRNAICTMKVAFDRLTYQAQIRLLQHLLQLLRHKRIHLILFPPFRRRIHIKPRARPEIPIILFPRRPRSPGGCIGKHERDAVFSGGIEEPALLSSGVFGTCQTGEIGQKGDFGG